MTTFFLLIAVGAWVAAVAVSPRPARAKELLVLGVLLRLVSSYVSLRALGTLYGGGDYDVYMRTGTRLALWMDLGKWDLVRDSFWQGGLPVWGTQFISNLVGVLVYLFGMTLPNLFTLFSLVGYAGCVLLAESVRRVYGDQVYTRVLAGVMLFPSLWFWPSILGKEPVVLLGTGMALLAFVSARSVLRPALFVAGIVVVFLIRPQIALVLLVSFMAGLWLNAQARWTAGRIAQVGLGVALLAVVVSYSSDALGFSVTDASQLDSYLDRRSTLSAYGGSAIEIGGPAWLRPLLGLGTVLFRPFVWEAKGVAALVSALETAMFWGTVWLRRERLKAFLRAKPRSALFWYFAVFALIYGTTIGVAVGNLGTLVRQRLHIYPALFLFTLAAPARRRVRRVVRARIAPAAALPATP